MTFRFSIFPLIGLAICSIGPASGQDLRSLPFRTGAMGAAYSPLGGTIATAVQILDFLGLSEEGIAANFHREIGAIE